MKKSYLLLAMFAMINVSFAQQKETPVTTIGSMTVKINMNQGNSLATITMTGPSNKWLSIGLGTTSMSVNKDVITYGTTLLDQYFTTSGHVAPTTDPTNNLTLVSNTVVGTNRTLVITRPLNTGDAKDYAFVYSMSSMSIVWAVGPSTTITSEHATFGSKSLAFSTVLGTEDFTTLDKISVFPNPSNGLFSISKNNLTTINKIRVFDTNAKLLKEITTDSNFNNTIDISELSKGIYFMEISNDIDQVVKKVIIE
jgi:Secretion system C-terminal sorting domain/DOMON domain